ncbi:MAG: hypothetical protein WAM82_33895, partial [Thermoanaerobaculia bacterium]
MRGRHLHRTALLLAFGLALFTGRLPALAWAPQALQTPQPAQTPPVVWTPPELIPQGPIQQIAPVPASQPTAGPPQASPAPIVAPGVG